MSTWYHRISGRSVDRLAALSDGIFAVSMTLLVLDLHVRDIAGLLRRQRPLWDAATHGSEIALLGELEHLAPRLLVYLLSFLTLGMFWIGQQTQLTNLTTSNRHLTWIHLTFLMMVSLMPFSTALLTEYVTLRVALVEYWLHLLVLGLILLGALRYAERAGLINDDEDAVAMPRAVRRRIVVAQALYVVGVLIGLANTYAAIAFIVLVQLDFALEPRIRPLGRESGTNWGR